MSPLCLQLRSSAATVPDDVGVDVIGPRDHVGKPSLLEQPLDLAGGAAMSPVGMVAFAGPVLILMMTVHPDAAAWRLLNHRVDASARTLDEPDVWSEIGVAHGLRAESGRTQARSEPRRLLVPRGRESEVAEAAMPTIISTTTARTHT